MSAERLIASHLRLASESLAAADALMRIGNRYAVYQAEQAVEQLILAPAQSENTAFTRSQHHQLDAMRRALPDANAFRDPLSEHTWLEAYATSYRYPKTMGGLADPPRTDRLKDTLSAVARLLREVAAHFAVDLDIDSRKPAAHPRPPRSP